MFTGSCLIKESFKYLMETQFEAYVDTKIGSTAVEHLHSKKSVLQKKDDVDMLVFCLHQDHKIRLNLKMCEIV